VPPKAEEAARAKLCLAAKPSIVPSAAGRPESELTRGQDTLVTAHPTPPRPFEAKRWRSEGGGGRDTERDAEEAAAASEQERGGGTDPIQRPRRAPATNFSRSWPPGPAASGARAGRLLSSADAAGCRARNGGGVRGLEQSDVEGAGIIVGGWRAGPTPHWAPSSLALLRWGFSLCRPCSACP
jgi:hypothetical protein